ncbi:MAG TPA: ribonuclease III [Syntrophomonadaceae bacterium]|nr:ribonuclease III [Syntrophomonadaceae bacterium]
MSSRHIVRAFQQANDLHFQDEELLALALVHPSYAQEHNSIYNNQRLEFLGDAVLDFIVAEYLYKTYADKAEGDLTQIRARVVCEKALAEVAEKIHVGDYLLLGRGEEMSGGRQRKSILADSVEAVIGAIYLDQGLDAARKFVLKHIESSIKQTASGDYQDFKSKLQEIVQARSRENVHYEILEENGPAHARTFVAGVFLRHRLLARGEGKSKKEAEQDAAEKVLKDLSVLNSPGTDRMKKNEKTC